MEWLLYVVLAFALVFVTLNILLRYGSIFFHYPTGYNVLLTTREIPLKEATHEQLEAAIDSLCEAKLQTVGIAPSPDKTQRYVTLKNEGDKGMFAQMFFTPQNPSEDEDRCREFMVGKKLAEDRVEQGVRILAFEVPSTPNSLKKFVRDLTGEYQGVADDEPVFISGHKVDFPRTKYAIKWQREESVIR